MKLLIIFIVLFISDTKTIKMSKEPIKKSAIEVIELITLDGGEDGYYRSISTYVTSTNYYVLDRGNSSFIKYDLSGKELLRFGKQGSGPGEFQGYEQINHINKDYIYIYNWQSLSIFSQNGILVKEIKYKKHNPDVIIKDKITIVSKKGKDNGYFIYELNGNLIKEVAAKKKAEKKKKNEDIIVVDDVKNVVHKLFLGKSEYKPYSNGFIRFDKGSYKLELFDSNKNQTHTLTRPFNRVKVKNDPDRVFLSFGGSKKKEKETNAKYMAEYIKATGGYEPDMDAIIGEYKKYVFVQVRSEEKETVLLDVISPDLKFYTQLKIQDKDLRSHAKIIEDKLILQFKNDDIGPYSKVYQLNFL